MRHWIIHQVIRGHRLDQSVSFTIAAGSADRLTRVWFDELLIVRLCRVTVYEIRYRLWLARTAVQI